MGCTFVELGCNLAATGDLCGPGCPGGRGGPCGPDGQGSKGVRVVRTIILVDMLSENI